MEDAGEMNLGGWLFRALNAGGNWDTSSTAACGPFYRNLNNTRVNVNANIGGRGSI